MVGKNTPWYSKKGKQILCLWLPYVLGQGVLWYVSDREGRESFGGLKLAIWALLGLEIFWWTVFGWWKDFGRAFSRLDKKRAYLKVLICVKELHQFHLQTQLFSFG